MSFVSRWVFLAVVLFCAPAQAASNDWVVVKTTSQVKVTVDQSTWTDVHVGDVVPNKAWLSTGPRGRLQLTRGVEEISLQPGTLASITTSGFFSRKTEVLQQVGSIDLEIEKRSQPHTTVQTPFLAAVVKGTIFHVTVGKTKASVSVDRGLVEVTSFASGQRSNIGPRQSAAVDRKKGMTVSGQVEPSIVSVPRSAARISAIGQVKPGEGPVTAGRASAGEAASDPKSSKAGGNGNSGHNGGGTGKGNNGNGNGNGGASGNGSGGGDGHNGGGNGNGNSGNGNGGGNGNGHGNGHGNGNGNGNGNGGGNGNNSGGNGNGNNGNGHGNGGANGNGNNGNGNGGKGNNK